MLDYQSKALLIFAFSNCYLFFKAAVKINNKGLGEYTLSLVPIGIFVWADALLIAPFWILASIVSLLAKDWILFLLFFSVFWNVRSAGEAIYYFNQQFSQITRIPAKELPGYSLIKNDYTTWFLYQVLAQLVLVFSIISSVYLFHLWL